MSKPETSGGPPWKLLAPLAAASALSVARWFAQGSGNVYTDLSKEFYVPDPDLGWRRLDDGPVWLGLDFVAMTVAGLVGLAVVGVLLARRERARGVRYSFLRNAMLAAAVLPILVPIAAFATGGRPDGGLDQLPDDVAAVDLADVDAVAGALDNLPAGTYAVAAHDDSAITAKLSAGGEDFDARFASGIRGSWRGDPGDFSQPMSAAVTVDVSGIDTGVPARSKHAREGYLKADEHPTLSVELGKLTAAQQADPDSVAFAATGTLEIMGARLPVEVSGKVKALSPQAIERLGLEGPSMLLDASFELELKSTPLAPDAGDFDRAAIPIAVTLLLTHQTAKE